MTEIDWSNSIAILGLAVITVVTRAFFLFSERSWRLPRWAERGLQYAPIAALAAVVLPEVLVTQGQVHAPWADARLYGALAGALAYWWRRDVFVTIVVGMLVYLPLRAWLGG